MATPSEKHEIHCAKRYLEYTETPFYRAFRDRENPESFDSNYAVLKRMEEAEQSLAAVESYYEGLDVTPKFYSKPDSVTLEESRAFFEAHGYAVHTFECQRMMLLTHTSPELLVHKCPVQIFAGAPLTGAAAQLVTESCGEKDFGLRLIDKQLGAGARVSFAYNRAEIPVVGEGECQLQTLKALDRTFTFSTILLGVPHTVVFVDDVLGFDWQKYGAEIERMTDLFPRKTNVNFAQVLDENNVLVRTFERGCGPTLACGTGASSVAVCCARAGKTGRRVTIHLELGTLEIEWAESGEVFMTGPAALAFSGEVAID